jgi:hypothetical protein
MGDSGMITSCWTWASARATGTSHIKVGKGCDDFGACLEAPSTNQSVLILVVSDGAGSANHSSIGAQITARVFAECACRFLREGGTLNSLSNKVASEWLDDIRDRISVAASQKDAKPREFASTLVGCLVGADKAIFLHVGDGSAVYRLNDASDWIVASWPAQGEYAATTYFVTDDPEPQFRLSCVEGNVQEVALFSDGIERLVLDFSNQTAFAPFFERMFSPLKRQVRGRDRTLSRLLKEYLDSPAVCEKTDDDKTLLLAKRLSVPI